MPAPTTCLTNTLWPRERVLFLLAGTATLLSAALSASVSPLFLLMTAAIGLNQLLLVATGRCPASSVVDRLLPGAPPDRPAVSRPRRRQQLDAAARRTGAGRPTLMSPRPEAGA